MKPVAVILNDKELVRLLTHLGLRPLFQRALAELASEFPRFPAKQLGGSAFGGKPAPQASLYKQSCGPPDEDVRYPSGRSLCLASGLAD